MSSKSYPDAVAVSVVIRLVVETHRSAYVLCTSSPLPLFEPHNSFGNLCYNSFYWQRN